MDLNLSFWLGLLLALPLSIVANILTPRFQAWQSQWHGAIGERRKRGMSKNLARLRRYKNDPTALWLAVSIQALEGISFLYLAVIFASAIIITSIPFLVIPYSNRIRSFCFFALFGLFFKTCLSILSLTKDLYCLQNFEDYERKVVSKIEEESGGRP